MQEFVDVVEKLIEKAKADAKAKDIDHGIDQCVWDVLTAIRGPDSGDYELKRLTTSRVRWILGMKVNSVGAIVNSIPLDDNDIIRRDELLTDGNHHFRNHFKWGLERLLSLGYEVPAKELLI